MCSVSARAIALKIAQNDLVAMHFLTRTELADKSQGRFGNKRTNIETIENG